MWLPARGKSRHQDVSSFFIFILLSGNISVLLTNKHLLIHKSHIEYFLTFLFNKCNFILNLSVQEQIPGKRMLKLYSKLGASNYLFPFREYLEQAQSY